MRRGKTPLMHTKEESSKVDSVEVKPKKTKKQSKKIKKRLITVEDIYEFHLVSDPQISPDGTRILFAKKHTNKDNNQSVSNIWMVPANGGDPQQFTSGGKDGHARWSPDGSKIAFISGREKLNPQIFTVPANGGEATALTKFPEGSMGDFKWSPDGKWLAVKFREADPDWTEKAKKEREEKGLSVPPRIIEKPFYRLDGDGYFNNQRHHLYLVDLKSGKHTKIFDRDSEGWFDFDWSPDSKNIAISANLKKDSFKKPWMSRIYIFDIAKRSFSMLKNQPDGTKGHVLYSPDGKTIAYAGREGRKDVWGAKNTHLFLIDANNGNPKNLTGNEDYCLVAITLGDTREAAFGANYIWSPDGKTIYMQLGWQGETHIAAIPASGGKIEFLTSGAKEYVFGNLSKDGQKLAMLTGSATEITEVAVGTFEKGKLNVKTLTKFNSDLLNQLELSIPQSHWINSTDSTRVQAWVMRPPKSLKIEKGPAVLEIHGGPHAQYGCSFFHEFQVLCANGYTVFFSNPRGSKGYGESFCNIIKGDWGNKDWQDIQSVTEFMKTRPFVDPKKMGVMGGSYGGYMTNWVISHTNVFAGAITDRCVSNLLSMEGNSDFPPAPDEYFPGAPWKNPEALWNQSPIKYFANVKTPTLIIHSEGDLRCNVEQAEQVYSALTVLGIPTRFVRYPNTTSHGMSRSGPADLRIHRLNQILNWWEVYLKGKKQKTETKTKNKTQGKKK